jgi:hypothetical protein
MILRRRQEEIPVVVGQDPNEWQRAQQYRRMRPATPVTQCRSGNAAATAVFGRAADLADIHQAVARWAESAGVDQAECRSRRR